jgi:hypothetical protein
MSALTLTFVLLYGSALFGWLKPLPSEQMVARLEPIIFVIIGYYFGRLPSQQNEGALKEEIGRQTQRAEAAQHAKEQAQQIREALEERMKNVRAALPPAASNARANDPAVHQKGADDDHETALRCSVNAALRILNS